MGWLIFLGVFVLLAILPLGAGARYGEKGAVLFLIVGPFQIKLYPRKKKAKADKKAKENKESAKQETSGTSKPQEEKSDVGGSWKDFLPFVQILLDFLNDFRLKLRVNRLELKIILAGDDPADLSISYGKAWAALGNLWPKLEEVFTIKRRNVEILCDYCADQTKVTARLDASITLGRCVALLVCYGIRALKVFLKIRKEQKG